MNFSLYTGNLHKVPDVPRRWPLHKPSISLQTFKKALEKRQEALIRLAQTSDASVCTATEAAPAPSVQMNTSRVFGQSKPDCPDPKDEHEPVNETCYEKDEEFMEKEVGNENEIQVDFSERKCERTELQDEEGTSRGDHYKRKRGDFDNCLQEMCKRDGSGDTFKDEHRMISSPKRGSDQKFDTNMEGAVASYPDGEENCDAMDCDQVVNRHAKPSQMMEAALTVSNRIDLPEVHGRAVGPSCRSGEQNKLQREREKLEASITPGANDNENLKPVDQGALRPNGGDDLGLASTTEFKSINRKAMKRVQLETKLKELQQKKHQLVQMLKQVLSSEEELKKRGQGSMQSPAAFGSPAAAVHEPLAVVTQSECKIGSELHFQRDLEDGELEYTHNFSPLPQTPSGIHMNSHDGNASLSLLASPVPKPGRLADTAQHLSQTWRQKDNR